MNEILEFNSFKTNVYERNYTFRITYGFDLQKNKYIEKLIYMVYYNDGPTRICDYKSHLGNNKNLILQVEINIMNNLKDICAKYKTVELYGFKYKYFQKLLLLI